MPTPLYKKIDVVGTSREGVDQAIQNAISQAGETIDNIQWFEVKELRGNVEGGKVDSYQVDLQLAFTVEGERRG